MNNMYKNHTQSEPKLSTATPAAWKTVVANVDLYLLSGLLAR